MIFKAWSVLIPGCVVLALSAGCAGKQEDGSAPSPGSSARSAESASKEPFRWHLDDSADPVGEVLSADGGTSASAVAVNGGEIQSVSPGFDGTGRAIRFPARCEGASCPHAFLQAPDDPRLNPGTAPFRFGLHIRVARTELSEEHGSNLLQKGRSAESQWKLQLDDPVKGRPSCVVRQKAGARPVVVKSAVGVADGAWHSLACVRSADALTIMVDGVAQGTESLPADYAIDPAGAQVGIGAKGTGANSDQFHGELDEIFYAED